MEQFFGWNATDEVYQSDDEEHFLTIDSIDMGSTSVKYSCDPSTILGSGLTAIVYPGFHYGIRKSAAVKFIRNKFFKVENEQVNELKIWSEIDQNVNVVRLYDSYRDPKVGLFLAMEKAESTFTYQITEFENSRNEVTTWLHQVSNAVEYLHGKGVIHRDIKPDNILMMDQDGNRLIAKLADFGVSKMMSSAERTSTFSNANGTLLWMAPEALENQTEKFKNTRMLDIYALGMTMYFGLSEGGHPFAQSKNEDVINVVVPRMISEGANPSLLDKGDIASNDLLQKMMGRFPENRPKIPEVVSHCLFWDWKIEHQFLMRAAICFAAIDCPAIQEIKVEIDKEFIKLYQVSYPGQNFNWINIADSKGFSMENLLFVSQTRKKPTTEYGDGTSASKFLKLFRDKYVHHPDMIPEAAEKFSQSDGSFCEEKYVTLMTSFCPGISAVLYANLRRYADEKSLYPLSKQYFPWKFVDVNEEMSEVKIDPVATQGTKSKDKQAKHSFKSLREKYSKICN